MSGRARRGWAAAAAGVALAAAAAAGWLRGPAGPGAAPPAGGPAAGLSPRAAPPRPGAGIDLAPGADLQAAVDAAPPGAVLRLAPGEYPGPVRIERPLVLWGPPAAVIRSQGQGSTIEVRASGVELLGFTVDGSGGRFDLLDAAVRVRGARGVRIEGLAITRALFGILAEQCEELSVRGNHVSGTAAEALGMRGDGIRLWETRHSRIEGNLVRDSRDVVVWYSSDNRIADNTVVRGRYGTHFMYSHGNEVVNNRYLDNVVGLFVMYSRQVRIEGNLLARARGAAGMGLGVKESGELWVRNNRLLADTTGIYLDTSPLGRDEVNRFERNELRLCGTAVVFHGRTAGNRFTDNWFQDNRAQVRLEGGGDALAAYWHGNAWDDYRGYDLDGDGFGDLPYELRSLSGELGAREPLVQFLHGTPALGLIELVGQVFPLWRPQTVLVDARPRMRLGLPEERHAG
ncbi:MAG: copper ABC transporter substrate-binding protein [Planctomycetota bacterium]|nr:MAG: copper ABC transporter substrate-binding protein [Planctomycetota bacterium]